MPYIKQNDRKKISIEGNAENAGDLNYIFTLVLNRYLAYHGLSYQKINDVIGALEGAKLEFYQRIARPYEDKAIERNGDVY